ncbi:MAG: SIMPL domain-containing protein [Pseudomonadota bacterium]
MKLLMPLAALTLLALPAFPQIATSIPSQDYQEDMFVTPYWTRQPVIEAMGRANMEVAPNRANFDVTYLEIDKDANDAMKLAVERGRLAYDTIKAVAGDSAIVQTSVDVRPYYEQYRDKTGNRIENERADKVKGYEARVSVSVEVDDVSLAGKARAGALALGPENASRLNTFLQATTELNRAAYEEAIKDAALRAGASAAASNATLGRLLVVQEGNGPCLGKWSNTPGMVSRSPSPAPAREQEEYSTSRLQTVTVTASKIGGEEVTITQADIDALNLPSDEPKQTISSSVCTIYAVKGD